MRAELKDAWARLGRSIETLDKIQVAVRKAMQPAQNEGRVTPFFARQSFVFGQGDLTPQRFSIVHSAGRVTRVTRLSYSVAVEGMRSFEGAAAAPDADQPAVYTIMRPNPRGMVYLDERIADPAVNGYLRSGIFDFEWGFSKGSTERQYAQGRTKNRNQIALSRSGLGNPEDDRLLLINEKHPLVLKTNEFLTIEVKPTFSWMNWRLDAGTTFAAVDDEFKFVVNITYGGYRIFGYE